MIKQMPQQRSLVMLRLSASSRAKTKVKFLTMPFSKTLAKLRLPHERLAIPSQALAGAAMR